MNDLQAFIYELPLHDSIRAELSNRIGAHVLDKCNSLLRAAKTSNSALTVLFGDSDGNMPESVRTPIGAPLRLKSISDDLRLAIKEAEDVP